MAKRIRHSILILILLQGGQNLSSLLLLPLLARALGPEGYGEVGFCIAFIGYFVLFADWGFGLSAVRQIAVHRLNRYKRSQIFWTVFAAKNVLAMIGAFILLLLIAFVPLIQSHALLLLLVYLTVMATVIAPAFYYQGMEALESFSIINLIFRLASIPVIYLMVKDANDLDWAIGIQAGAQLLAACINFIILLRSKSLEWVRPVPSEVMGSLKQSWPLFLSGSSGGIFSSTVIVILGFVAGPLSVGYFVGAYNLIKAGQGILGPISQVMFSRLSHLFEHAREEALLALKKIFTLQSILGVSLFLSLFLLAPIILPLLMGEKFNQSIAVFRILTPLFVLGGLSNLLGQQMMTTLGYHRAYALASIICGVISLILTGVLGYFFLANGAALATVIVELISVAVMVAFLKRREPNLFRSIWHA